MAKKLINISNFIEASALPFRQHLEKTLSRNILDLFNQLSERCDVYVFSGVIRNYFLKITDNRDIDIIYDGEIEIETYFKDFKWRKNSYGGYKVSIDDLSLDIWQLQNTWALHYQGTFDFDLAKFIPQTSFFNFSSIVFWYNENKFIFTVHFERFLRDKEIELAFAPNANVGLCIVNSLYYSDKLKMRLGHKLVKYVKQKYARGSNDYEKVQLEHFGMILYTPKDIIDRVNSL